MRKKKFVIKYLKLVIRKEVIIGSKQYSDKYCMTESELSFIISATLRALSLFGFFISLSHHNFSSRKICMSNFSILNRY